MHAYETWGFKGLNKELIEILNIWARFIYGPLLEDRVRAIADGVLGEFTQTNLVVNAGYTTGLGALRWQPKRHGRTVWEIGVPDRTAREFRHGDHYWQWGLYFKYVEDFPNDVNFIIGQSDWRRDWNYVQPPRIEFPCPYPIKVMGVAGSELHTVVCSVMTRHDPAFDITSLSIRDSAQGNYQSVTVTIVATGTEQLQAIFADLKASPCVKMVL